MNIYDELLAEIIPDYEPIAANVPVDDLLPPPEPDNILDDLVGGVGDVDDDADDNIPDYQDEPSSSDEESDNIADFVFRDLQRIRRELSDRQFHIEDGRGQLRARIQLLKKKYNERDNEKLIDDMISTTRAMMRQIGVRDAIADDTVSYLQWRRASVPLNYLHGQGINMFALALAYIAKRHMGIDRVWRLWSGRANQYEIAMEDIIRYMSYIG